MKKIANRRKHKAAKNKKVLARVNAEVLDGVVHLVYRKVHPKIDIPKFISKIEKDYPNITVLRCFIFFNNLHLEVRSKRINPVVIPSVFTPVLEWTFKQPEISVVANSFYTNLLIKRPVDCTELIKAALT
jgi:hypothetical protein